VHPPNGRLDFDIAHHNLKKTVQIIAVDRDLAVHVAFPQRELGSHDKTQDDARVRQSD
jgi:hypothetical protein